MSTKGTFDILVDRRGHDYALSACTSDSGYAALEEWYRPLIEAGVRQPLDRYNEARIITPAEYERFKHAHPNLVFHLLESDIDLT